MGLVAQATSQIFLPQSLGPPLCRHTDTYLNTCYTYLNTCSSLLLRPICGYSQENLMVLMRACQGLSFGVNIWMIRHAHWFLLLLAFYIHTTHCDSSLILTCSRNTEALVRTELARARIIALLHSVAPPNTSNSYISYITPGASQRTVLTCRTKVLQCS